MAVTRREFYAKSLIYFTIGACFVFFADDKSGMILHANWVIVTIMAYGMWHPWTIFPRALGHYVARKLFGTEATPEGSPGVSAPVEPLVGQSFNNEGKS